MISDRLIQLAGADAKRFEDIEHERGRYAALGAALLVPAVLGAVAITSASRFLGNGILLSLLFAGTWSAVILTIDRVLVVTTLRRLPGERFKAANLLAIVFRILLAALVGVGIGFVSKLALASKTAKQELADERQVRVAEAERPLRDELKNLEAVIAEYNRQFDAELGGARAQLSDAISGRTAEAQGTAGSRRYGDSGPGYRAADAEVQARKAELEALEGARSRRLAPLLASRSVLVQQIEERSNEVAASTSDDLFAEVRALVRVLARYPYLWWFTAFLAACLVVLELVPIVAKAIIVRDSAYAFRERMRSWVEEERLRVELEALSTVRPRRVELRVEFMGEQAEWEAYEGHSKLASKHARTRPPDMSFRAETPKNATSRGKRPPA